MKKIYMVVLFTGIILAGCKKESDSPLQPETEKTQIAFVSNRETLEYEFQVFVMNIDGTNQRRLTHDSNCYLYPHFSPDGSTIVFYSQHPTNSEIYLIDANGENMKNLTQSQGHDRYPQFSPDGSKITFVSDRDGNREIYLMNSDGSNQTRLTNNIVIDHAPQFSPDGRKILFYSTISPLTPSEPYNICTIDIDGSHLTQLTPDSVYFQRAFPPDKYESKSAFAAAPSYSPDGSKIVFMSFCQNNYFIINLMNSDGTDRKILVDVEGADSYSPRFVSDGSQVVFQSHRNGDLKLYRMALYDGAPQQQITFGLGEMFLSDVSENGSQILYQSNLDEIHYQYYHIYLANADGGSPKKLTTGSYADYYGDFQH